MTQTSLDGTHRLSHYLAVLLPHVISGSPNGGAVSHVHPDVLGTLRSIAAGDAELRSLAADDPHPELNPAVLDRLARALDGWTYEALEALATVIVAGTATPTVVPPHALSPRGRFRTTGDRLVAVGRRVAGTGWIRRQIAGVWMNALVAVVLAVTWWMAGPPPRNGPQDGYLVLAVFAVWCLSFLPGWLYIRFLGQRASALWDEYVLALHRLAGDQPRYLPEPPATSEFHDEWRRDGGPQYRNHHNIYRKKFDAYYGKSVSDSSRHQGNPVRIETLFPVLLATVTLAACWSAALWDLRFLGNPAGVWDVLKFGFLGAYLFIFQMLIRRYFQSDLRPTAYAAAMLRIITVLIVVAALHQVVATENTRIQAAVAFVVGFFPLIGMHALQRGAAAVLRTAVPSLNPPYPLNQIDGLSVWYEARLLEEGIEDMQSLATANFVDVMLHTRVPVARLVDWVDQAQLYLHFDRIERGWLDRALNGHANTQTQPAKLAQGSVDARSRAGTRTRTALRQLGIRKATDVLNAFPFDRMNPDADPAPDSAWGRYLESLQEDGMNLCQLRTIVRVLHDEPALAPVWNWQRRGVRPR